MSGQSTQGRMNELMQILKKFGIEGDPDWMAVVLFVRNLLTQLTVYSDEKKGEIQREVFNELLKNDFSPEHFETVIAMLDMYVMQTIGTLELEEALTSEKRSAAMLLNEMDAIIDTMHGTNERQTRKLDAFKEQTVGVIRSGKDKSVIISKVREMFQELIVEFKEEAKELQERAKLLEQTAKFDPLLTELHNRGALDSFLHEAVSQQAKDAAPLSMMMIDVDHFKVVNDTYGHQAGDDVLRALARILTAHASQFKGFSARYGGEELVIVMKGTPLDMAIVWAETIRATVETYDFRIRKDGKLAEDSLQFTVSIGVAQWREGWDVGKFVSSADKAMYEAKNSGRNQVQAWMGD